MASKRKRVVISFADKLAAIEEVEKGSMLKTVAANYGVGVSTVSEWVKYKSKFLKQAVKNSNKKTSKTSDFEKLNDALYLWFTQQRDKGIQLKGPKLQEKAKMLAELLGEEGKHFCPSIGWLNSFKKRYGIRRPRLCGEKLSTDSDAVDVFETQFEDYTEGYSNDQIYNADETSQNQPLDKGVIEIEMNDPLESVNKKHVVYLCAQVWDKFQNETLQRCRRKLYNEKEDVKTESFENLTEMVHRISECEDMNESDVDEWIVPDKKYSVVPDDSDKLAHQNIVKVEAVLQPTDNATENSEADDVDDGIGKVTADDGFNALELALKFVEQCRESTPTDVILIKKWRDIAARKRCEGHSKNQAKITDFFNTKI